MRLPRFGAMASFFLAAILTAPAWGNEGSTKSAVAGTLNYVEGQASIGDQALNSKSIGTVELQAGQSLVTEKGKAEVLLTPGVFLRIGNNSFVKMIPPERDRLEVVSIPDPVSTGRGGFGRFGGGGFHGSSSGGFHGGGGGFHGR
jgi:hypothetical protein